MSLLRGTAARLLACTLALGSAASIASPPEWVEGAVVYAVVPPLFGERPFVDTTERLGELQRMGVDAVWLSPINATDDPSAISYAVTDFFALRPDFGSAAELRALVREAHIRGMRVLMDFVPNHTSSGHPWFVDASTKGRASPYYDFYDRGDGGEATHYFDWEHLKNLDYDNPRVQQAMIDAFTYWVREFGIDGFRVDAAWGPRERSPAFWNTLSIELRKVRPDVFLLAEASAHDPYYVQSGFDSAYDWTTELGKWSWEHVFTDRTRLAERLDRALGAKGTPPAQVTRFLNNNDTGVRFITRHGVETARVAAILLLTLPGIPVVYTGDEVGAEYEPYEDPPPISWEDRHGLKPLYTRLIKLRDEVPALARGGFTRLETPGHPAAYVFVRDAGEAGAALVALNFDTRDADLVFDPPTGLRGSTAGLVDALSGEPVEVRLLDDGRWSLSLKAGSGRVLLPRAQ